MYEWNQKRNWVMVVILFIFIFSMGLRINAPRADLPSHITFSGSILTDEGNQCHNSRAKALYGEWYPDDWRITNYNPVLPYIKYTFFKLFGVGITQLRLVSFLFAFLTLAFLYLTLRSYLHPNHRFALLGTLLLGCNFFFVMYNKIATFETAITFWVVLCFYFLEKYRSKNKSIFLVLSGAAAFMGFVFKSIMAYLVPLPFAACLLICLFPKDAERRSLATGFRNLLLVGAGVLVVAVPWYLFHYLPNKAWIISAPGKFMGNLMLPHSLDKAWQNFLAFNWKSQLYKIPVIWLGALLYIPLFSRRVLRKRVRLTEAAIVLFFLAHTFMFFFMSYRPTRYFVPLIPAMVLMTVLLFKRFVYGSDENLEIRRGMTDGVLYVLDVLWLTVASAFCFLPLISRYIYTFDVPRISLVYLSAAAVLVGIYYLFKNTYRRWIWKRPDFRFFTIPLLLFMVGTSIYISLSYYWQWNREKTFSIRDMSLELEEKLEDAYIGGMTAPAAVLENRHKALWLYPNFVNWDRDTFKKYPLSHALLGTDVSREIFHFFNRWPVRMSHAALQKVYHIKDYFLHFYSFKNPYISEAKQLEGAGGKIRLTAVNPTEAAVTVRVGRMVFASPPGEGTSAQLPLEAVKGKAEHSLPPGTSFIDMELPPVPGTAEPADANAPVTGTVFYFLDYSHPFSRDRLRYEGEMFRYKTGDNERTLAASSDGVRRFLAGSHAPGFMAYGPAVPYGKGIIKVHFKMAFSNLKSKLRPLCRVDIFSHRAGKPVAEKGIKSSDIKRSKKGLFSLSAVLTGTDTLEFRVKAQPLADITLDYVDLEYVQGIFVDWKKEKEERKKRKGKKRRRRKTA